MRVKIIQPQRGCVRPGINPRRVSDGAPPSAPALTQLRWSRRFFIPNGDTDLSPGFMVWQPSPPLSCWRVRLRFDGRPRRRQAASGRWEHRRDRSPSGVARPSAPRRARRATCFVERSHQVVWRTQACVYASARGFAGGRRVHPSVREPRMNSAHRRTSA